MIFHPQGNTKMILASDKLSLRYVVACDAEQLFHYTGSLESSKYLASKTHLNPQQTQSMLTRFIKSRLYFG